MKRPFFLAIALGVVAGVAIASDLFFFYFMEKVRFGYLFSEAGTVLGCLVFPSLISCLGRHRYFWWGMSTGIIAVVVAHIASFEIVKLGLYRWEEASPGLHDWMIRGPLDFDMEKWMVAGVAVSAGTVSLVRYIIQLRRGLVITPEEAASIKSTAKEGAWPPPPAVK